MAAFGMSQSGKDARGWINEYGRWEKDQYKGNLEKSQTAYDKGTAGYDQYAQGVQDTKDAGTGFLDNPYQNWNNTYNQLRNNWANVAGKNTANVGAYKDAIDSGYQYNQNVVDTTSGRNDQVFRENQANIADIYGRLQKATDTGYSNLRTDNTNLFTGLRGDAKDTYTQAGKRADYLKPASEAAQSMVARAYSPQMASTAMRLQQAGLRPGDPQYEAAMSRVESQRARGMDDDLANRTAQWVNTRNTLDQAGLNTDLNLAQTGAGIDRGLTTEQLGIGRDLGTGRLNAATGEENRWLNVANQTDANRQANTNQRIQNYGDWSNRENQTNTQNFQIDAQIGQAIAQGNIDQAMQKYAIQQQQLQQTGDVAKQRLLYAQMFDQLARAHGQEAANAMMQSYQLESANSGWASKLLAGVGGAALNMVAPGMGSLVSGGTPSFSGFVNPFKGGGGNAGDFKYGG